MAADDIEEAAPPSGSAAADATPPPPPPPTNYNSTTNRATKWFLLLASSTIVFGSIADDTTPGERTPKEKWTLALAMIVMLVSIVASLATQIPSNKISKGMASPMMMIEGVFIVVSIICTSLVIFLTQSENFVGMNQDGTLSVNMNINVYYFSWIALFSCVALLTSLIKERRIKVNNGVTDLMQSNNGRLKNWFVLFIFGLVILCTASKAFKNSYCDKDNTSYCKRSELAISVGVITVALTLVAIGFCLQHVKHQDCEASRKKVLKIEAVVSGILAALHIGSVGFITGSDSPGGFVGNLYYFSWMAFLLSVILASQAIGAYVVNARSK